MLCGVPRGADDGNLRGTDCLVTWSTFGREGGPALGVIPLTLDPLRGGRETVKGGGKHE